MPDTYSTDSVTQYIAATSHRLLTADEERQLAVAAQSGDETAWSALIVHNLRLVIAVARRYVGNGVPLADLIQEGNLGLMHAIEKFEPERGYRLSTYAMNWIRQAVTRAIADQARTIRLPVHMAEGTAKARNVREQLLDQLGRDPTAQELADALGVTETKARAYLDSLASIWSLDAPTRSVRHLDDEDRTLGDIVAAPGSVEDEAIAHCLIAAVQEQVAALPERERAVVELRYGLRDGQRWTLEEVGQAFGGLSRERVRQIEVQALRRLRRSAAGLWDDRAVQVEVNTGRRMDGKPEPPDTPTP